MDHDVCLFGFLDNFLLLLNELHEALHQRIPSSPTHGTRLVQRKEVMRRLLRLDDGHHNRLLLDFELFQRLAFINQLFVAMKKSCQRRERCQSISQLRKKTKRKTRLNFFLLEDGAGEFGFHNPLQVLHGIIGTNIHFFVGP